jgi:heme/copper-type cytochrome/quinol oxidase subunit 4
MKNTRRLLALLFMLLSSFFLHAQADSSTENLMRSNGRIYVVITVILIILAGLILYLVRLDRKMSKLEKNN